MNEDLVLISTTVEKKADGERLAALLLERRLVACVQISSPMTSIYRWQGQTVVAEEFLLVLKTRKKLYDQVEQLLLREHPYSTPEILAQDISRVGTSYRNWVMGETS